MTHGLRRNAVLCYRQLLLRNRVVRAYTEAAHVAHNPLPVASPRKHKAPKVLGSFR
jgi:hypothetical protein